MDGILFVKRSRSVVLVRVHMMAQTKDPRCIKYFPCQLFSGSM